MYWFQEHIQVVRLSHQACQGDLEPFERILTLCCSFHKVGEYGVALDRIVKGSFRVEGLDRDGYFSEVELSTENLPSNYLDHLLTNRPQFINLFRIITC